MTSVRGSAQRERASGRGEGAPGQAEPAKAARLTQQTSSVPDLQGFHFLAHSRVRGHMERAWVFTNNRKWQKAAQPRSRQGLEWDADDYQIQPMTAHQFISPAKII